MSQSSVEITDLEGLRKAGYPVKQGIRVFRSDQSTTKPAEAAIEIWLHRWAKHACQNYHRVSGNQGIRFLNDCAKGLPAIVVGIGPSLDNDLPTLKEAQDRAIIISTDAAYKPLLAHGIRPTIALSFDCKAEQSTLWENIPPQGIACLFDSCAHPRAIQSWQGPVLFYNHWHQQDEFSNKLLPYIYPEIGQLPSAGTVGNMGLLAAKLFGCDPIIAVGMDFCYKANEYGWLYRATDYSYNGNSWEPCLNKVLYDNDDRVKRSFDFSIGGKTYRTDPELSVYAETFSQIVKSFGLNVVNVSADSMIAGNHKTMPLKEVIETYCRDSFPKGRTIFPYLGKILGAY